ncbi:MAG: hydroxyacylglutathione hydrolase [Rhizobiales bacterium]|nr:hydroxyacylglutathione hydrolase [Hyphomicrobiales bacterium]
MQIIQIPCRQDNYAVLIHDDETNLTLLFDAPEHEPIAKILQANGWDLDAILITHYHYDHVEAAASLKNQFNAKVYGPKLRSEGQDYINHYIQDLKEIRFGNIHIQIFQTPGHIPEQIVYYIPSLKSAIVADTIFSLGCARILGGTAQELFQSLELLKQLPDDTNLYCGHEYTQSNGEFAISIDPNNQALIKRIAEVKMLRSKNLPTLPTTLSNEKSTNPFLRCYDAEIRKTLNMQNASDEAVFTELRLRKDSF